MQITGRFYIICSLIFLIPHSASAQQDTTQIIIPNRENASIQQQKPYVILISIDGLRHDLVNKYDAVFLKTKRNQGIQAKSMRPSFPSLTFPNHYSIITGLYPAHHGIVANTFFTNDGFKKYKIGDAAAVLDGSWYGGTPLWVLAEQQKMITASFYWVGSEANIKNTYPTYYYKYNEKIPLERRISIVREWLQLPEPKRPHFITFYMPEVDHAGHRSGIPSGRVQGAVQFIDHAIKRLNEMTDSLDLPINYILVSDHGMMNIDTEHPIKISAYLDSTKFKIAFGSAILHAYAKDKSDVLPAYRKLKKKANGYTVYLKENVPAKWNYSEKDDYMNRLGDIIMVANPTRAFSHENRVRGRGAHGYDNFIPEMQAVFYAWGPLFKQHKKIKSFANVNVYPLIAKMLGLTISEKIDGEIKVLEGILK
ncbi:MAG: alkaline phosphatase family protein [Ferruginibacter sp.]|nr:alkaline phosphatase family protein [Ferruginibacter sp.]